MKLAYFIELLINIFHPAPHLANLFANISNGMYFTLERFHTYVKYFHIFKQCKQN